MSAPKLKAVQPELGHFGALLSRSLPCYTGPHDVGAIDVELAVERQEIGSFRQHKVLKADVAGFALDTVLFTLFYPCEEDAYKPKHCARWLPNLKLVVDGFIRMAGKNPNWMYRALSYPVAAAAILGTTFPSTEHAPFKPPPSGKKYPLVIFSHGVGCTRLMYSATCGELASRGYVVAAVEHRDGTGPSTTITTEDGHTRQVDFLNWKDLDWPELEEQPKDDTTLRHDQIAMRLEEIREAIVSISMLTADSESKRGLRHCLGHEMDFDWDRWKGTVDVDELIIAGHSLGGSAALAAAADNRFNPKALFISDPAIQRIEPWTARLNLPIIAVNSEEFHDSDDFDRLMNVVAPSCTPRPEVFTIAGSTHPSFSDVFLIVPSYINRKTGLKASSLFVLRYTLDAVDSFLRGSIQPFIEDARAVVGRQKHPIGMPGEVLHQEA